MERIYSRFGEAKYLTLRAAGKTAVCAAIAAVEPEGSHRTFPGTIKKPLCEGLFLWRPGEDSNL